MVKESTSLDKDLGHINRSLIHSNVYSLPTTHEKYNRESEEGEAVYGKTPQPSSNVLSGKRDTGNAL